MISRVRAQDISPPPDLKPGNSDVFRKIDFHRADRKKRMTWELTGSKYIWQNPVLVPYFVPFSQSQSESVHIRVSAATGPGEPFRHTEWSI